MIWHCRVAKRDRPLDFLLGRLSSRIIVNSRATGNRFDSHFQKKVKVVYNGIDLQRFREESVPKPEGIDPGWQVILVVARASKWKRHDLVLSAFESVAREIPNAHLFCIGSHDALEPEWWSYLRDRTRNSDFARRIHWIGQVEDVRPWYNAASILVLASENEPFGRVLVEAMACGVPVVATKSGGIPEIITHMKDGLLVDTGNVAEIANAMGKILEDRTMRERIARNAQKRAEYFDLDIHVKKMVHIFEDLIKH